MLRACAGLFYFKSMIQSGVVSLPFTKGEHAPIAAADQARVIAALLEQPTPSVGKIYPLSGPVLMTFEESFRIAGKVLGKPIEYRVVSMDQYEAMWKSLGRDPFFIQHIVEVAKYHTEGGFSILNDEVENITGQKPMSVAEFVAKNEAQFLDNSLTKNRLSARE